MLLPFIPPKTKKKEFELEYLYIDISIPLNVEEAQKPTQEEIERGVAIIDLME
ncbi:MAG TPA: hypothetical protein VJ201_00460 [Candidatus Babeliales bacterium]|nr:hypothetical protein [Candidatus Babeliales bacterium]